MSNNPKLRSLLICDSVQRDARGLATLRGLYPHRIVGSTKPWARDLTVYLAFENRDLVPVTVSVRITAPTARYLSTAVFDQDSPFFDFEVPFMLLVTEKGRLEIEWRFAEGKWKKGPILELEFSKDAEELSEEESDRLLQYYEIKSNVHDLLDRIEFNFMRLRYGSSSLGN